jgi:hypothetical protein
MAQSGYRIADEPKPGALARFAVDPLWPFLAVIFSGAWLSWSWFVINGFAVGSPTRRRELAIAIGGFVTSAAVLFLLLYAMGDGVLSQQSLPYALLGLTVVKIAVTYWLHVTQAETFEIYTYYGGVVRSGVMVLFAGYMLDRAVGAKLLESAPFFYLWLQ